MNNNFKYYEDDYERTVLELFIQNNWNYRCGYDIHREKDDIVLVDSFSQYLNERYGLLSDDEVNDILKDHGIKPIHRQGGDKTLSELGLSNVHESVSYDKANRDEVYSDYNVAKARADELNLCLAEYGNINNISYCYWNKSGNRDDAAEIFVYYKFVGGKPEPLDDEEMQNIAMEYGVNFTN